MSGLTTDDVRAACRLFLDLAYPEGEESIPKNRRDFARLPPGLDFPDYQKQNPFSPSCLLILRANNQERGYVLRLGCSHFPHLKMKVQGLDYQGQQVWVFAVDTHDSFAPGSFRPPPDHPDARAWTELQDKNAALKKQIESAWESAGIMTFNGLLRIGLNQPPRTMD
jgi:hypothetical protein